MTVDVVYCTSNFLWLHRTHCLGITRILIRFYRIYCESLNNNLECCEGRNNMCIKTNRCFNFLNDNYVLIKMQNCFEICLYFSSTIYHDIKKFFILFLFYSFYRQFHLFFLWFVRCCEFFIYLFNNKSFYKHYFNP